METMYPGIVNSPMTELAAAIDDEQTIISLVDASKLPAAPNQATIGNGESAETILYTGVSGNDLTGVTRGFQGTAQDWVIGAKVSRKFTEYDYAALKGNTEGAVAEVIADDPVPISLVPGPQIVDSPRVSRVRNVGMSGRTLVNLLGRDGNCEDASKWTGTATNTLDAINKLYGNNALKLTVAAGSNGTNAAVIFLNAGKFYLLAADIKNGDLSVGQQIGIDGNYSTSALNTAYGVTYKTYAAPADGNRSINLRVNGSVGQFGYFDGVRLYEITSAEKTYIDGLTIADAQAYAAAKYPYVDDMKHVEAVHITNRGKNLIPPFAEWNVNPNAVRTGPYSFYLVATLIDQYTSTFIPVVPNTTYTMSVEVTGDGIFAVYDFTDNIQGSFLGGTNTSGLFTTPATCNRIGVFLSNGEETSGTFTFANPMLNIGTEALPFEPQQSSHLYLWDMHLASNVDRSVRDELYMDGEGKPRVTRRIGNDVLDGSFPWTFSSDGSGFKWLRTSGQFPNNAVREVGTVVKYDGKILTNLGSSSSAPDGFKVHTDGYFYVGIADTDSGWGESYTPTADEIKAYFNGWKMYDNSTGATDTSTYTRTDGLNKRWGYKTTTGTWNSSGLGNGEIPTFTSYELTGANLPLYRTPYRLMYQLAQSVDEAVSYEGELMMHDGPNQVEVGTGIVVREAANPILSSVYRINHTAFAASLLKLRTNDIKQIYRSDVLDRTWTIERNNTLDAYGGSRAATSIINYDPVAAYSVTYEALDKYLIGIAPLEVTGEVVPNIKEAVDDLTRALTEAKTQLSVLANTKAQKQQPGWIAPTLLNGWVNFTGAAPASYMIDELGYVHLRGTIGSGATTANTPIMILPVGYRSIFSVNVTLALYSSGSNSAVVCFSVTPDGRLISPAALSTNFGLSLDGIIFRAEQ